MHNVPNPLHASFRNILVVLGTRPEAIKLAPVINALRSSSLAPAVTVAATGQHRELVAPVLEFFGITPEIDLDIMHQNQSPASVVQRTLERLDPLLEKENFDLLLVQGDTASATAGALAGFYRKIPVGHVEAGLRTGNRHDPFPEEMNRRLISQLSSFHFAPTEHNRQSLLSEGVQDKEVYVTGNTVIDALHHIVEATKESPLPKETQEFVGKKLILLTTHRRENFGEPQRQIFHAINQLLTKHRDIAVLFPVHPNPNVQAAVKEHLHANPQLRLLPPLDYITFIRLMKAAWLVLTDSGGIQEEAPALGIPALVLRETTERTEALQTANVRLIGTATETICTSIEELLSDPEAYAAMAQPAYPFGEQGAAERIRQIIMNAKV